MSNYLKVQTMADSLCLGMLRYARLKRLYMHDVSFDAVPMVQHRDVALAIQFALDDGASQPDWFLHDFGYDLYRPWMEDTEAGAKANKLARQVTKLVNRRIVAHNQKVLDGARRRAGQQWSVQVWPPAKDLGKLALV